MVLDISDNPRCSSRENKFYVQETKLVFLKKKKKKELKKYITFYILNWTWKFYQNLIHVFFFYFFLFYNFFCI